MTHPPIKRLFDPTPKVTDTNKKALARVRGKVRRRQQKILRGTYKDITALDLIQRELRFMELRLHGRREIERFVRSGSANPDTTIVWYIGEYWKETCKESGVEWFDSNALWKYLWTGYKSGAPVVPTGDVSSALQLASLDGRVVDVLIAQKILTILRDDMNELESEVRDISHGGQQIFFRFAKR